jgi:hypothetical protein
MLSRPMMQKHMETAYELSYQNFVRGGAPVNRLPAAAGAAAELSS